jgi:hypothetical protein
MSSVTEVFFNLFKVLKTVLGSTTGCFTMNDTKVVGSFSGLEASSDLKHVAKFT